MADLQPSGQERFGRLPQARTRPIQAAVQRRGPLAVVLLHGQPGTGDDWQPVVPQIEDRYTLVVADRPGYGRTGGPATGFAGNAAAVVDLLDRLGLERAVLVGHSWAGGVALAAAIDHPDRVSGMVLVSSVGPGERLGWDDRLMAAPVLGEVIAAAGIGGVGLVLARPRVQALAGRRLDGRARDVVTSLTRLTGGGSPVWRSFVAEQRALVRELDGLAVGLRTIRAPAAIVHGSLDRLVPATVAETLAAAIPGADLRLLSGAGHLVPRDRPDAVAAAVDLVAAQTAR